VASKSLLSVRGLTKKFGGLVAVNNVSFDVTDRAKRGWKNDHIQPNLRISKAG